MVPIAGAMAARTKRIRFNTDICLLPFNHPIRLAEDLAVLDNLSNGRVEIGVGMGYAPHEFRGFGIPVSRRVSLTDEGVEVLRRCFTGENFSFHGKRYRLRRRAGSARATCSRAARRCGSRRWRKAARCARPRASTHLLPQGARDEVLDPWRDALRAAGRDPRAYRVGIIRGCLVTDDRERDWPRCARRSAIAASSTRGFFAESGRFSR